MKYLVFDTEQEALEAEAQISRSLGYPKVSVSAATELPAEQAEPTQRWAIPAQISDGRWVFISPDDSGVEADASWWPAPENYVGTIDHGDTYIP